MSNSQLGQDLWAINKLSNKENGYFIEIGAYDGKHLSNTYLLETKYKWQGICIEANPNVIDRLRKNRKCIIEHCAVSTYSNIDLEFLICDYAEISCIKQFAIDDTWQPHIDARLNKSKSVIVKSKILSDIMKDNNTPKDIDYISLDIEGNEEQILYSFDFDNYNVALWTVEHNGRETLKDMIEFMSTKGYKHQVEKFDVWFSKI